MDSSSAPGKSFSFFLSYNPADKIGKDVVTFH
jgi:hypothetical protein